MTSPEVTQITVAGKRTGIINLGQTLEAVAREFAGRPDDEIRGELMARLSKRNYIVETVREKYAAAFLREYKKFVGEPYEEEVSDFVQVKVLGAGCPSCEKLERELMALIAELKIPADLEHVRNPLEISSYGIMGSPALIIDGEVKAVGNIPLKSTLKRWLEKAVK